MITSRLLIGLLLLIRPGREACVKTFEMFGVFISIKYMLIPLLYFMAVFVPLYSDHEACG